MKKWLLFLLATASLTAHDGVTYEFSGGRFGDNLLAYLHAKWVAHREGIPLLYKPFPYSSELALDEREVPFKEGDRALTVPYFPETQWEVRHTRDKDGKAWSYFAVDWSDCEFRQMAAELIAPKQPLSLIRPPPGMTGLMRRRLVLGQNRPPEILARPDMLAPTCG